MKKVFPFYKGKNITNNPLGYTNEKNSRKRMDDTDVKSDFENTLPEDYWLDHYYVYELEYPYEDGLVPGRYNVSTSGEYYNLEYYTRGYINLDSKTYLKDIKDEEIYKLFIRLYRMTKIAIEECHQRKTEHKEEYKKLIFDILHKGWKPCLFKDISDYKKQWKKFVDNNVEFREMEVEINVK